MLIFIVLAILYGAANFYLFFKISSLVNPGLITGILTGTAVLFMTLSPFLIPMYSHRGSERTIRVFSYIGYMWLAFIMPFFPAVAILDLYNLVIQYGSLLTGRDFSAVLLSLNSTFLVPVLFSFIVNIYGYFEARDICVERLVIRTPKLPGNTGSIRIAQISDLHLGIIVRDKTLHRVIHILKKEKPDIIVSTGDLVDGATKHIDHLAAALKKVKAGLGKFAVMGNHEIYGGPRHSIQFIRDAGFTLLRGEGTSVEKTINIAGVDFTGGEAGRQKKKKSQKEEWEILAGLPEGLFTLLLKHRSDVEDRSLGLFDLQLSGHTHKGQIFPMGLVTMFLFKHHSGFTKLPKGSSIYVSRGTGTAGPPVRFLSRPEITVIDIMSE